MEIETSFGGDRIARTDVSFGVHDVAPETPDLPAISLADSLTACLRSGEDFVPGIVAVSDTEGRYLELPSQNGLLAAVHLAFSRHLPLTLSPDTIWLAILQGFSRHVRAHAPELEGRLMMHSGKHTIEVTIRQAQWDWPAVFDQFATALEGHAGPWVRELQADFSTTGKIERTASHVALMDVFSPYVQYICACICGIPSIHLEGQPADWVRLREKLALLRGYDADGWVEEIDAILGQFGEAAHGRVDRAWWQQIYKLTPRYGGEDIEGWLGAFFPYLKDEQGTFTRRRVKDEKFTTEIVPPGLSDVRMKFITRQGNDSLRVVSGFVGVEDLGENGVRPKIGWAVVRNHFMESFVETLDQHPGIHLRPGADEVEIPTEEERMGIFDRRANLPVDLQLFYRATDGADLYGNGAIHPLQTLLRTENVGHRWQHLGAWNDGSLLLTDGAVVRLRWAGWEWEHQTLATSFSDFIARLTAANGSAYWEEESFIEPEITPLWNEFHPPSLPEACPAPPLPRGAKPMPVLEALQRQNRRLRSMKLTTGDVFVIRPVAVSDASSHLPAALHSLYRICDGVSQVGGFDLWPAARVAALPGTNGRWFEVGAAPGYRILFDGIAHRGVAVIDTKKQRMFRIAQSFEEFLRSVEKTPQGLYWEKVSDSWRFERPAILWPDERIDGVHA